jgi:hypothetical protein
MNVIVVTVTVTVTVTVSLSIDVTANAPLARSLFPNSQSFPIIAFSIYLSA